MTWPGVSLSASSIPPVDADGRLLDTCTLPASLHDNHGGMELLRVCRKSWPFLQRCFADNAYAAPRGAGATGVAVIVIRAITPMKDTAP